MGKSLSFKFNDLGREYGYFKQAIDKGIANVLTSGQYLFGPHTKQLESNFRLMTGKKHCIAVKNATDAITVVLQNFRIDTCILPNFGAYPTAIAAVNADCTPMFVDVNETLTLQLPKPNAFTYSGSTMAVIGVNLFGNKCDLSPVQKARRKNGLLVIEDCAQSTDPLHDYSLADVNIFSFYPTKPLASMGDGGMICLDDDIIAARIRNHCFYGLNSETGKIVNAGINSRIDETQASIVNAKWDYLERLNLKRQKIAYRYRMALPYGLKSIQHQNPARTPNTNCIYHQFPILFENASSRKQFADRLTEAGIPYMIHYPEHVSEMPAFIKYHPDPVKFRVNDRILSLPCNSFMSLDEINQVMSFLENYHYAGTSGK